MIDKDHLAILIEQFKNREIKAKVLFDIREITKPQALQFISKFHYLGDAKFFSMYAHGLFLKGTNIIVGAATYSNPQGIVAMKSWFNLSNQDQSVVELSRLCITPTLNGSNAASYLLGNSCKMLAKKGLKAVITLADKSRHVGSIYQVCNFKYFGLTDYKTDFYCADGRVNPRGQTKNLRGVWLPRSQKHRYALFFDSSLVCNYSEQSYPNKQDTNELNCCNGSLEVYDARFGETYSCPRCCGEIKLLTTHAASV